MRDFKHVTPRYIRDRLAVMAFERGHPDAPWLTAAMIEILESWLQPDDRGLEWGSGRSTTWFAGRVRHLVSIEQNPNWAARVEKTLRTNGLLDRVTCHVVPIEAPRLAADASSGYVSVAETIAPESLDFCLIDGDLRNHCALAALKLVKPEGLIIIDDVERYLPRKEKSKAPNARGLEDGCETAEWELFMNKVARWRSIWTTNGVSDTALWVKPCAVPRGEPSP